MALGPAERNTCGKPKSHHHLCGHRIDPHPVDVASSADTPTDHHTLFLAQLPSGPGFNHAAFEVRDIEDVLSGHNLLKAKDSLPAWGIGRHYPGSQVFDYWRDPWGHTVEHWTDGDMFTAEDEPRMGTVADLLGAQWGPAMPADF